MPSLRKRKEKGAIGQETTNNLSTNTDNGMTSKDVKKNVLSAPKPLYRLIYDQKTRGSDKENPKFNLEITFEESENEVEIITPGEGVIIAGSNKDQIYVAKVLSFFKNHFAGEINASIRWYYTIDEIPKRLLPKKVHENEIFLSSNDRAENINAETIEAKCEVTWVCPDDEIIKSYGENEFFYRKSFNGKTFTDVFAPEEQSQKKSLVEQRNVILSPKRIRQTPSKYNDDYHEKSIPNGKTVKATAKTPVQQSRSAKKPAKKLVSSAPQTPVAVLPRPNFHISSVKLPASQVESEIMTSPISASTYGKLEAAVVALNILSNDDSDDNDDTIPASRANSKSFENSKRKSAVKPPKSTKNAKKSKTLKSKELDPDCQKEDKKHITPGKKIVISIPKVKIQNPTVERLKVDEPERTPVRFSPRRKSKVDFKELANGKGNDNNSDTMSNYSDEHEDSSSDESYEEEVSSPTRSLSRSVKRIRISSPAKTTVTPILVKMPRGKLPYIRARQTPVRSAKGKLEISRERLHVSAVPECLPCRETEFQEIFTFVEGKIRSGGGGCMYVSGVPGTGKTATVREVMNCLRQSSDVGDIPEFTYVDVNGMRLTEPRQAYVQLLLQLTKQKATPDHAANLLTKMFSQRRKVSTVVLADELDLLWTKKQDVLYHLFDWPTHRHAKLIVVAIANTMDLPERILMNRVASRLGLTRLTFRPYTFKQLQEIVASRLDGLKTFESDAIQLTSRKVAAVSGDARRCLDICRRATEIAERNKKGIVGIEHVHTALQEMFATPMIRAIRACSTQEKLFLHAVVAEFRRSGMEEATLGRIIEQHTAIAQLEGAAPVSVSTLVRISQRLATNRLILLEGGNRDLFSRIRLNVSVDDVLFSLKQ